MAGNLRLRGARYHFRKKLPVKLRQRLGQYEVVRSLETSDYRLARQRSRFLWLATQKVFDWVDKNPTLTKAQVDAAVARFIQKVEWADEIRLAADGALYDHHGDAPHDADALIRETDAEELRAALAHNDTSYVQKYINTLKLDLGPSLTQVDEKLLGRALLAALAKSSDTQATRLRTEFYPYTSGEMGDLQPIEEPEATEEPPAPAAAPAPAHIQGFASMTFSEAWSEAMADNLATSSSDDADVKWDEGKVAHAGSTLNLWTAIHGHAALSKTTPELAITFRRTAARLPALYHREKKWRDWPVADIIADADLEDARGEKDNPGNYQKIRRVSPKTVNRHISVLKTTWEKFVQLRLAPAELANPFNSLHTPVRKTTHIIIEERDQFTLEEICILFAAPVWTGCRSKGRRQIPGPMIIRDWKYWVPLLGAYTGMRREEICALTVADFEQVRGIWIINLRKAKKRLKTPGSPRYVPIHDHLIAWGILGDLVHGRDAKEWLFPDLKPSAVARRRGEPFGKWFTPLRRKLGIYRPEVVFHSFRHTVATALRNAEVYMPFVEEITGHEDEARQLEIKRYTKEALVENLKAAIDKLDYGLTLPNRSDTR
ncbi:site-specific integrase [Devosia sp. FJ2-5-3]|uniref:site-specific integrase n=1 Tax=Devosia sp. FJ2-5-3 TaxID=2976680 RepID=UPI0023D8B46B|nr:site-specific integrase [Devosia sp. FJ2-5-3]WEJ57465.1 site-specific integrase [Devosia sp. FJ2-5-3]